MSVVVQTWVRLLPWKQQSILFSGLRGPDTARCPAVKSVSKWMRSVSQENADPSKPYMASPSPALFPLFLEVLEELEFLPCHFVHHFADALAVVAYGHPDEPTWRWAYTLHALIAEELFHFIPEPPEIFAWRHRDKLDGRDDTPDPPFDDRPWMAKLLPAGYEHR